MTDADDRPGAGEQDLTEPKGNASSGGGGDAALEQRLAPIVLEGEQVPAVADDSVAAASEPSATAFNSVDPRGSADEPRSETQPEAAADAGGVPPSPTAGAAPVLPPPGSGDDRVSGAIPVPDDLDRAEDPLLTPEPAAAPTESLSPAAPVESPEQPVPVESPEQPVPVEAPEQPVPVESPEQSVPVESSSPAAPVEAPEQPVPTQAGGEPASAEEPAPSEPGAGAEAPGGAVGAAPGTEAPTSASRGQDPAAEAGSAPPAPGAGAAPVLPPAPDLSEVPADAGSIVTGRVREVRGDDVVVDLDDGRVGVINRRNLGLEGDLATALSPGDAIEGAVLARSDPQHRVVLSRTWALKKRAWEAVAAAAADHEPVTGTVVSVGQKGVVVDVGVRGFVPASHLELGPVQDLQSYAGRQLTLRVLDLDPERERLVLSRRSLLLKEQRRSAHDALSSIQPGEVRRGTVSSLSEYGAFVDVGGVTGLVHLSELSWHRVRHPSEVLSVGDEVEVKVLDVKIKKRRVSLSIRQLSDDPLDGLTPGEIRTGPVTRLVDFGAFVDLAGVEGLVHLSELAEYRVSAPEEIVAPGEEVRVKVLSVDRKRRRVELSIRQAAEYGG